MTFNLSLKVSLKLFFNDILIWELSAVFLQAQLKFILSSSNNHLYVYDVQKKFLGEFYTLHVPFYLFHKVTISDL